MNQTVPDQECNTIIVVWPSIYKKKKYWREILEIYCKVIDLLLECNNYIFIIKNKNDDIFKDISRLNNTLGISKINSKKYKNLIKLIDYETNDIWIRDYGPQIALNKEKKQYFFYNYHYNAYGKKYPFDKDNDFSNHYVKNFYKIHKNKEIIMKEPLKNIILEGGNIINNGSGLSLFNKRCLELNNNKSWIEIQKELKSNYLKNNMGSFKYIDIDSLSGDDTNGHIDNLIRFHEYDTLLYMATDDNYHPDYYLLKELKEQIININKRSSCINNLIAINHDTEDICKSEDGLTLPFSYLNYVITNKKVIIPIPVKISFKKKNIIKNIFINKDVAFVNSSALLNEYGNLHCCTLNSIW